MEVGRMSTGLELRIGRNERFGKSGLESGLLAGWSNTEEAHVWNDGVTAALLVSQCGCARPLVVDVSGQPYLPRSDWVQDITLYANGWFAGFWRFRDDKPGVLHARIEPAWWFMRSDRAYLQLTFLLPNSISPAQALGEPDRRQLAFCFRTIEFRSV
jgi:hypothetical protein